MKTIKLQFKCNYSNYNYTTIKDQWQILKAVYCKLYYIIVIEVLFAFIHLSNVRVLTTPISIVPIIFNELVYNICTLLGGKIEP